MVNPKLYRMGLDGTSTLCRTLIGVAALRRGRETTAGPAEMGDCSNTSAGHSSVIVAHRELCGGDGYREANRR